MYDEPSPRHGMSRIVRTVAGWLTGFILLFGVYVVLYGHETPGGGFAGGVCIAIGFVLLTLAYGQKLAFRTLGQRSAVVLSALGALIFLGMALAGLLAGGVFFRDFIEPAEQSHHDLFGATFILLCEIGIALVVAMSLFLVFSVLARARATSSDKRRRGIGDEEDAKIQERGGRTSFLAGP